MKELVGTCSICGVQLFCVDGFFQGHIVNNQNFCLSCRPNNERGNSRTIKKAEERA
ncbi:hypothetical protein [Fictibacillus norfolkensis]|uniref:SR1 protein n=1 Tax=Fictibacillus norfolkensis TaxID=2762233 RepID=A0ABR8SQ52_9BACL|nr:hypothetical protein [Fictibacillus norfolkensis]MBD7965633.1 hypothetical protein [Fictibacillus norfolkensis]